MKGGRQNKLQRSDDRLYTEQGDEEVIGMCTAERRRVGLGEGVWASGPLLHLVKFYCDHNW